MLLFACLTVGVSAAFLLELFDGGLNLRVLLLDQTLSGFIPNIQFVGQVIAICVSDPDRVRPFVVEMELASLQCFKSNCRCAAVERQYWHVASPLKMSFTFK